MSKSAWAYEYSNGEPEIEEILEYSSGPILYLNPT